jgi:hypothetical protein
MPSTSKKQHNFMEAIAHNPAFAKKVGIKQSVGKDFAEADKEKKFSSGGLNMINRNITRYGRVLGASKGVPAVDLTKHIGKKEGGIMATKKMMAFEKSGKDVEKKGMKEGSKADMALDKKQMAGMKKGGMATKKMASGGFTKSADGIASKGKTKAKQVTMKKGGYC